MEGFDGMSQRIEVINYIRELFQSIVPESHYLRNKNKKIVYPYQTFSMTGEPVRFQGQGFYIDIDIFSNGGNSDVAIEKALSGMIEKFSGYTPFHEMTNHFLIQIEYRNDNAIPTGSDTLQRRNIQLYAKIDWRK